MSQIRLLGWSLVDEPRTPPSALEASEGWRLLGREAARCRRYGGTLSLLALQVGRAEVGVRVAALLRDVDFVARGRDGELLICLPGSNEAAAMGCAARVRRELCDLPSLRLGYAELGESESIDSLVLRARRDRDEEPVRSAA